MYRKKPSLKHFHVWGCRAEIKPYNPYTKKLMLEQLIDTLLVIALVQGVVDFIVRIIRQE